MIPSRTHRLAIILAALLALAGSGLIIASQTLTRTAATQSPASEHSGLMLARPCRAPETCHTTWTLTSRLGEILESYEKRLGARNPAYRLLGIEFTTTPRPGTWYPDFGNGHRSIIVQLTKAARHNKPLALFQIAHEAFHLLEPVTPGTRASYLEEGVASYFALVYLRKLGLKADPEFVGHSEHRTAYDHIVRVASLHPDFESRLRTLREMNHSFSRISADEIRAAFPETPARVADELARPFPD